MEKLLNLRAKFFAKVHYTYCMYMCTCTCTCTCTCACTNITKNSSYMYSVHVQYSTCINAYIVRRVLMISNDQVVVHNF